jgi:hypothetical protein
MKRKRHSPEQIIRKLRPPLPGKMTPLQIDHSIPQGA